MKFLFTKDSMVNVEELLVATTLGNNETVLVFKGGEKITVSSAVKDNLINVFKELANHHSVTVLNGNDS